MLIAVIALAVICAACLFAVFWLQARLRKKQELDEQARINFEATLQSLNQSITRTENLRDDLENEYRSRVAAHNQEYTDWAVNAARDEATARAEAKAQTERLRQSLTQSLQEYQEEVTEQSEAIHDQLQNYREEVAAIIAPLQTLAKAEADRRYYCLDIPATDSADIKFLVENVAPHISNTNLIPKLCWSEYVSKAYTDLVNKTGIKDEPGIYKITNINTKKCYVGKAVSVKKRLADHLKGACGMTTIADQTIHHAIVDEGFTNWTFEVICYCEKEQLNERERFYIAEFHGLDWGYNKNAGGGG